MNIKDSLLFADKKLSMTSNKSQRLEAEILLSFATNKNKEFLYTHPEAKLTKKQLEKLKKSIALRNKGLPIAYIINKKEFFGLDFYVDKNVLIPRPETELMVEMAESLIKRDELKNIVDLGTGSGAIAVSLAKINPNINVVAIDISKKALAIAKKNAKSHKVNIKFTKGDLLFPIKNQKIDLICANLPYLKTNYLKILPKTIAKNLAFEPKIALGAGQDGLSIYKKLFEQIKKHQITFKYLIIEIDHSQKKSAMTLAKKYFNKSIILKKDLAKLNRFLIISG